MPGYVRLCQAPLLSGHEGEAVGEGGEGRVSSHGRGEIVGL